MRQRARVDNNQVAIVKAFRDIGATVQVLSAVGKGCPDLLVGWRSRNFLVEVKDGSKPPSARALTSDQCRFLGSWAGSVIVATSVEDAVCSVIEAAR